MSYRENSNNDKKNVDPNTNFIIGSPEYNAYYFPKQDKPNPNTTIIKDEDEKDER